MEVEKNNIDNTDHLIGMEFVNASVKSYFEQPINEVISRKYTLNYTILILLLQSFTTLPSITLIAAIITLIIFPNTIPYGIYLYATQLIILQLIYIFKQIYFDQFRRDSDGKLNDRRVKVYRGQQQVIEMAWSQVRQGDIVFLTHGEVSPADILLLDSQQIEHRQAITYVDTRNVNGQFKLQRKKSSYLTQVVNRGVMQKRNWQHYRKLITGKLNFQKSTGNLNEFTGYLKLTKDPKVQKLSIQNIILRNSSIQTSLWVYGLVIYVGKDCKITKRSINIKKQYPLIHQLNYIFRIWLCCNLLFGSIFALIYVRSRNKFQLVSYHFLMFSVLLPHMLYIALYLFLIFFGLARQIGGILICNYMAIVSLGSLDFAMLPNTGIISSGEVILEQIVTSSSIYDVKGDIKNQMRKSGLRNQRRHASSARSHPNQSSSNKLPFMSINNDLILYNQKETSFEEKYEIDDIQKNSILHPLHNTPLPKLKSQLEPLKVDRAGLYNYVKQNQNESTQIIRSFAVCHNARFFYNPSKDKYMGISCIKEEEVLLKLINEVGWELSPKLDGTKQLGIRIKQFKQKLTQNGLKVQSKVTNYEWVGINAFQTQRNLFSVVVREGEKCLLYCKGKPQHIINRLKVTKDIQKIIQNTVASYKDKDAQSIIYCKRQLTLEEKQQYENDYSSLKLSLTTTPLEIQEFSSKYQRNLQFICIVGLGQEINLKAEELIDFLSKSGIKICMLGKSRSDIGCFKSLLPKQNHIQYVYLDQSSSQLLKYYLNYITNQFRHKPKLKYAVITNGDAWKVISKNKDIMNHFMFVVYHSEGLLAFDFDSHQTQHLAYKLKNSYPRHHSVLGIGYSSSDLQFLGETDVSIAMSNNISTDVKVDKLQNVIELLQIGPYLIETLSNLFCLVTYRVTVLAAIILVYEIALISHNASFNIHSTLVYIYLVFYSLIQVIYIIFLNRKINKLQKFAYYLNFRNHKKRIYLTLFEGIIHGIVIMVCTLASLPNVRLFGDGHNGQLLSIQALYMSIFMLLIFIGSIRHLFSLKVTKLACLLMFCITMIVMSLCIIIASIIDHSFIRIAFQVFVLILNYDSCTLIINITIFCLSISMFLWQVIQPYIFPEIADILPPTAENSQILNSTQREIPVLKLIKHLFKEQQSLDSSIIALVPKQIDVNTLKINSMLQIRNKQSNIKYLFERCPKCILVFILSMMIAFSFEIILIITNGLVSDHKFNSYLIPLVLDAILLMAVAVYMWRCNPFMNYYKVAEVVLGSFVILTVVYIIVRGQDIDYYLLFSVIAVICTQPFQVRFSFLIIILSILLLVNSVLLLVNKEETTLTVITEILSTIICFGVNMISFWRASISTKVNFIISETFEKETIHVNDVLSILVPKFVKNHLENNYENMSLQQEQNKVAILFCYVCSFDEIVKEEGKNVVILMDELFRQFDKLCHNFAVQKIETVGMTYMAATGIKDYEDQIENQMTKKNKVERLLKMGIQMLEKAKSITWGEKKNKRLKIKIGIHAGDVIVGVIGFHKPQFSLIGDTVNTTSRHCSTAAPGQIVLSEVAFKMVKRFSVSSFKRDTKQMKGLGTVSIYRFLKNEVSSSKHLKIRMRFISIVKKVIQKLKQEGKINYKVIKASEIAQKAMQRNSTKKITIEKGVRRSSIMFLEEQLQQIDQTKNHKTVYNELKYNQFLQPIQKYPKYNKYLLTKFAFSDRIIIGIIIFFLIIELIFNLGTQYYNSLTVVLRCIAIILTLLTQLFYKYTLKSGIVIWIFVAINIYSQITVKLESIMIGRIGSLHNFMIIYSMVSITILSNLCVYRFIHVNILGLVAIILTMANQIYQQHFQICIIYQLFYILSISLRKFIMLKDDYENYGQIVSYQKRTLEQQALVSQLLPKHAYEKLKNQNIQNRLQLTDKFENVTMLFADIKGFTSYSNQSTPAGVVKMLRELFQQFDKSCLKHKVYKVYTIGDCYVVLGFIDCYKRNILEEAKNVVNMGLQMVEKIQKVREAINFPQLDMRIGIHTGTIIGGIIGTEIVRYDIYGPDVMIANKFEEYGKTGHIHISQSTKEILDQDKKKSFNILPHGSVKVQKLNVQINGYILTKKKFEI